MDEVFSGNTFRDEIFHNGDHHPEQDSDDDEADDAADDLSDDENFTSAPLCLNPCPKSFLYILSLLDNFLSILCSKFHFLKYTWLNQEHHGPPIACRSEEKLAP